MKMRLKNRVTALAIAMAALLFAAQYLIAAPAVSDSALSHINLWTSGEGGYADYRIPGLLVTKKGTVLAYAAARRTLGSDWADADVVLRRSTDGGRTFSSSQRIAGVGQGTFDNPTAISDRQTGDVVLLYQQNYAHCFVVRSHDDGLTFSAPVDITDVFAQLRPQTPWNVVAPGPTHAIQLRNGRLVVPVWMANGSIAANGHPNHAPSFVTTIYSDDHGRTWKLGDIIPITNPEMKNPSETVIAQLGDGRVFLSLRTESPHHRRVITTSPDGATHWSTPAYDEALFDPVCDAGLIRGKIHGKPVLLFSNPDSSATRPDSWHYPRLNMTVRMSLDDGKTWPVSRVIDPGIGGYSDLAITADGTVLCFYESGWVSDKHHDPAHLTLIRLKLDPRNLSK
jgi:sialidase-1